MFGRLSLTKTGLALLAAAIAYCGTILFIDIRTASEFSEAFLYSLALILVYPVRRPWAIWFVTAMGVSFTIFGKLFEEEVEAGLGGLLNRGMAIFLLFAFAVLLQRITTVERVLFRLSTSDPLTGALNRRQFMALLNREQKRAERYGARFSVLMIDIDHFKKVNDTYGHQIGDEAIKRMAETCQAHLRPTDLFCRYGGEEFLVALTHTDEAGAKIAAERIREGVAQVEIPAEGKTVRFTISVGVACFVPQVRIEQLIDCADQALYVAKTGGRNQVQVGRLDRPTELQPAAASA